MYHEGKIRKIAESVLELCKKIKWRIFGIGNHLRFFPASKIIFGINSLRLRSWTNQTAKKRSNFMRFKNRHNSWKKISADAYELFYWLFVCICSATHERETQHALNPGEGPPSRELITRKEGVAAVEPQRTIQTPALEWDVSPEGEVEVEWVSNGAKRPTLEVIEHLCAKHLADSTWGSPK